MPIDRPRQWDVVEPARVGRAKLANPVKADIYNACTDENWELAMNEQGAYVEDAQELRLRFGNTLAYVKDKLMMVSEIQNGYEEKDKYYHGIRVIAYNATKNFEWSKSQRIVVEPGDIKPFIPSSRLFTIKTGKLVDVGYMYRIPLRQNRKSYDDSTYGWDLPYHSLHLPFGLIDYVQAVSPQALWVLENTIPHIPYEQALKYVSSLKGVAVSFCDDYYVGLSNGPRPIIGYKNFGPCAVVDENGTAVLPKVSHHLFEDLSEHVDCKKG